MANILISVNNTTLPVQPSKCTFSLKDISTSDSGRAKDTTMNKVRLGQAWTIQLEWAGLTSAQMTALGRLFNPVYLFVNYYDQLTDSYVVGEFYKGDSTSPVYNSTLDIWTNLSFNLIQRKGLVFNTSTNQWITEGTSYTISTTVTNGTSNGSTYGSRLASILIIPNEDYGIPTQVSVNGRTGTSGSVGATWTYNPNNGLLVLENLSANLTISATCPLIQRYIYSVSGSTLEINKAPYATSGGVLRII